MVIRTPTTKGRIIAYRFHPTSPKVFKWIAKVEKIPERTVSNICAHWEKHGHIYPLPRTGRPPRLTPQGKKELINAIQDDPKARFDVFGEKIMISQSTVRRVAHKNGFHSRICREAPLISAVNREKRVAWAKENVRQDWDRVMFTDEACFHVGETGRERVIRRAGTEYEPQQLSVKFRHGKSLHVWGAVLHGQRFPLIRFQLRPARTVNHIKTYGRPYPSHSSSSSSGCPSCSR